MSAKGSALITGGSRRIGREIALTLAQNGWRIALHYNHSRDDAETLANEIKNNNGECEIFCADLSDAKAGCNLIAEAFERCPDLNVLINNASIFERMPLLETQEDFFDRHFNINFKSPFFLTRDFARQCKQGNVINLLDTKITQKFSNYFAYTLTKKALYEFTRMAAKELAPAIRVNGVCPGLILPPPGDDEAYIERMQNRVPMKTRGHPKDIASAVLFLLENEFITGDCIFIDGGEHLLK